MSWLDQFAVGGAGGAGGGLSEKATGQIVIDTRDFSKSRAVVVRESRMMGSAIEEGIGGGVEKGATRANTALRSVDSSMSAFTRNASLALAAFTTLGTKNAQSVKQLTMLFEVFTGSQEKANEEMEKLREQAERTNQPFLDMVSGANSLLPALRGTNADLSKTVLLAQRLAIMDPVQGISGAGIAIREFVNGEYQSLWRRLELDRTRLQQILDESNGDVALALDGLSAYIDEIGLSEEKLVEMGESGVTAFSVMGSELKETTASVFTPFLNDVVIPLVRGFGDLMRELRQVNPELQKFAGISAGILSVAAVGHTGLPMIGAIPGGAALAKGGVMAAAAYGGANLGALGVRGAAALGVPGTGSVKGQSQSDVLGGAADTMKQAVLIAFNALTDVAKVVIVSGMVIQNAFETYAAMFQLGTSLVGNALAALVDVIGEAVGGIANAVGSFLMAMDNIDLGLFSVGLGTGDAGRALQDWADGAKSAGDALRTSEDAMSGYVDQMKEGIWLTDEQGKKLEETDEKLSGLVTSFGQFMGVIDRADSAVFSLSETLSRAAQTALSAAGSLAAGERTFVVNDEALEEWGTFQDDLADIDREAARERAEVERDHKAALQQIDDDYHADVEEENQSFYESQRELLANAKKSESAINKELAESLVDRNVEYQETIAEIQEDAREDEAQRLKDHQDKLAEIERDGRESIYQSAARLDAQGVLDARRQMKEKTAEEKKRYAEEQQQQAKNLHERLQQEQEAHEERIESDKENAQERLESLWEQYAEEREAQQENHRERLSDMQSQYAEERAEETQQFRTRLSDIAGQAARERQERETQFITTMNQIQRLAGIHQNNLISINQRGQATMEADLRAWWERMRGMFGGTSGYQPQTAAQYSSTYGTSNLTSYGGYRGIESTPMPSNNTYSASGTTSAGSTINANFSFGDIGKYTTGKIQQIILDSLAEVIAVG